METENSFKIDNKIEQHFKSNKMQILQNYSTYSNCFVKGTKRLNNKRAFTPLMTSGASAVSSKVSNCPDIFSPSQVSQNNEAKI